MGARAGQTDRAQALLNELRDRFTLGSATNADLSYVLSGLGVVEEALDCLERACDSREGLLVYLKVEPMFDPLRTHPRFENLMHQIGLA